MNYKTYQWLIREIKNRHFGAYKILCTMRLTRETLAQLAITAEFAMKT